MPSLTAMVTASSAPIKVTKRMARSLSPNQMIASGSQQIEGSVCRPSARGPSARRTTGTVPFRMPRKVPSPSAIPKATIRRTRLIRGRNDQRVIFDACHERLQNLRRPRKRGSRSTTRAYIPSPIVLE